ncbi:MAG: alpha-glucosidase [Pedosphaera sp. Tous-C6FEB]|nr:MAG: alpha-glucosidase [Pedosphaera sp. Tous-C6FEB]
MRVGQRNARTDFPPLPAGEGRGEGEGVVPSQAGFKCSRTAQRTTLATTAGKFSINRRTGAWTLHDSGGLEVFRCSQLSLADAPPQLTLQLAEGEAIFGLGESTGPFNKRGLIREFWNADVLGHASCIHPSLRNLYVSIPFALSLREGRAAGLFWDNPARQTWDIGCTEPDKFHLRAASRVGGFQPPSVESSSTGTGSLYLFLGPTPAEVVARFTELTGRMPLPPRWALGYQQSRYGYASRAEVERIAREFRRRQIPCDALHLDIHHMDGHRVFTFGKAFPRPREMLAKLARRGFKAVAIVDPGVKDDPKFGVLKRGVAQRAFVKAPGGRRDFIGKVWPGKSRFPDFLNAPVRDWWATEQAAFQRLGLAGIWNDMNEPALFDIPGKTLPDDAHHECDASPACDLFSLAPIGGEGRGEGAALAIANAATGLVTRPTPSPSIPLPRWGRGKSIKHALVHNLYGSAMAAASRKGALLAAPDQRPFILTRAGYAGIQRHAAVWTGDNSSTWEHLAESIPMLLNLSLSGVAFCGADVGGFLDHCTGELLARWTQMGAFTPFFRNHANNDSRAQEPWAFGPAVEAQCRDAIALRYQLLPYLSGLFAEAHRTGAPIMRPLLWHHPNDPAAVACADQFLLGASLLVAPILRPEARVRSVYLPVGQWFDFWSGELYDGGQHVLVEAVPEHIPVFVRGGSVVPTAAPRQFISGAADPVVNLHVWPHGRSAFTWQEDDGESLGYERGELATRTIEFVDRAPRRELVLGATQGAWASRVQTWRIVLRSARRAYRVWVNDRRVEAGFEPNLGVCLFDVANAPGELRIKWL